MHHVVNGGQYLNQMARSVDYSAYLVNTALESTQLNPPILFEIWDICVKFQRPFRLLIRVPQLQVKGWVTNIVYLHPIINFRHFHEPILYFLEKCIKDLLGNCIRHYTKLLYNCRVYFHLLLRKGIQAVFLTAFLSGELVLLICLLVHKLNVITTFQKFSSQQKKCFNVKL